MKLIVFGSTGLLGQQVVQQAKDKGFEVTAFCRDASTLQHMNGSGLNIITGDVFNPESVDAAIKGHDAVCVILGSGKSRKSVVRSEGTKHVIAGMKKNGVERLICVSTLGAGDSKGSLNFFWRRIMFGWLLKDVFLDHELQETYVQASNLSWTVVRPAAFIDGDKTGHYQHGFSSDNKTIKRKISRKDVADFLVKELIGSQYVRQSPGLSY